LEKTWRLLKNVNIDLPYDPAIPFLGIYPKEWDTGYSRDTCTPMFIAALFTIVRLARLRRPKIVCSPSYADIRSRANTTRGLDLDHMIRREHTREV
jgi:hypothetical protein